MPAREVAGDEAILERLLDDHDVPDDPFGFHVQQAVEKRLKTVLALNEIEFQHTHSIGARRRGADEPRQHDNDQPTLAGAANAKVSASRPIRAPTPPDALAWQRGVETPPLA